MALAIPGWLEEHRQRLTDATARSSAAHQTTRLTAILTAGAELCQTFLLSAEPSELTESVWQTVCESVRALTELHSETARAHGWFGLSRSTRAQLRADTAVLKRYSEVVQVVLLARPDLELELPADLEPVAWTLRISPLAYLRAMFNLWWSAIRHPLSETTIDLSTGRVLYRT